MKIKVKLQPDQIVMAELLEDRPLSVVVKLPDGNIIVRKKFRQVDQESYEMRGK